MAHMTDTQPPSETVAGFYDVTAAFYDTMTDMEERIVHERPFFRVLVERYGIRRALDAGSGTGMHSLLLAHLGVEVVGVDISREMLTRLQEHARNHGVSVHTIQADLTHLPTADIGKVDGVFCLGNTVAHVLSREDLSLTLSGFRSVMKENGLLVLHTLNYRRIAGDRETELNRRERGGKTFRRSYTPTGGLLVFQTTVSDIPQNGATLLVQTVLHRPWPETELNDALANSGFSDVQIYGGIDLREFLPDESRDVVILARPQ